LDHLGLFCQSPVPLSADLGGRTLRPGPFDPDASGLRVACCGHGALATLCARSIFRGEQAHTLHACSGALTPWQGTHCRHQGAGDGAWHPTPGVQGLDHRVHTPGFDLRRAGVLETLEACAVFAHGSDLFWKDDVWSGRGTDHRREPPQGGRAPIGPSCGTASVSEHEGLETPRRVLQIAEGVCTCAGERAHGCLFDLGDIHGREVPRARQSGQLHGVPTVGVDAITGFFGDQRGCDHPAVVPFLHQIPLEPGATGTSFRDEDHVCGLRWHLAEALLKVTLAGAKTAERGDRGAMSLSYRGDRDRVLVDIHADKECARLRQS
jgi:hypothetical protein